MPIPIKVALRAAIRVVRMPQASIQRASVSRRYFQTARPLRASEEYKRSFQGQLYQSAAERVKGQRAEEARLARLAEQKNAREGSTVLMGLLAGILIAGSFYYLGTQSLPKPSVASTAPLGNVPPPQHNLSVSNLEASWTDFVALLGSENVSTTPSELERHSTSDWSSHPRKPGDPLPFLIVYPSTTEEVSEVAKICHRRRIPMTAFSGGTSLEGHFAPTRGGVVVNFHRMDKILEIHDRDLDVVVQPAVGWEHLNYTLEAHNMFFPPDPGPGAMIGGMVGTGCSGTNAARYGTMKEWVLSLTVVLADGTIIKTRRRPRKSSAGYDLTRLFVGSEGTLGLVTEATLKLTVKPPYESVAVASFGSIREATDVVEKIVAQGIQVAAVELLDDVQMRCIIEAGMTTHEWKEAPTLFLKFGGTQGAVKEQVGMVRDIIKKSTAGKHAATFEFAKNDEEAKELWEARKEALWSVCALKSDAHSPTHGDNPHAHPQPHDGPVDQPGSTQKVWTTDVAVPVSRLSEIVEITKRDIAQWSEGGKGVGAIVGHVGDGNFHCILLFEERERPVVEKIVKTMITRAVEMDGTVTGEHGVGLVKRKYLEEELGTATIDAMRKLKLALDPLCLLNCDKVVKMDVNEPGKHS